MGFSAMRFLCRILLAKPHSVQEVHKDNPGFGHVNPGLLNGGCLQIHPDFRKHKRSHGKMVFKAINVGATLNTLHRRAILLYNLQPFNKDFVG